MTGPEVLISGGDDDERPPRRLPAWLRLGVPAVVVLGLLVALGVRLAGDQRRHERVVQAADEVDAIVRINELGLGGSGTVVVGIQVSGRGAAVQVGSPRLHPSQVANVTVTGVPAVVDAGSGQQLRMRLQPHCDQVRAVNGLEVELPITPASGKRHVVRLPFPDGPDLVRRACGYLPVQDALTMTLQGAVLTGSGVRVHLSLRNDGREPITVRGVLVSGLEVELSGPVVVSPREASFDVPLIARVAHCPEQPPSGTDVRVQAVEGSGRVTEVPLDVDDAVARVFRAFVSQRC